MRIAFDVSPLSHPLLGIGNYIQGSLGGLVEAAGDDHEIVAFAPTSIRGPERIRAALDGIDVELQTWRAPFSHALRTGWSMAGRPAAERLLGAFDVLHFSDWMYPPQRAGVRATTIHDLVPLHHPEWTTAAHALDARPEVRERCTDVRRRVRQLAVHGRRRRSDARRCAREDSRRAPGREGRLPPRRPGRRPGWPVRRSPSPRSSRARTSRRSSRPIACSTASFAWRSSAPRAGASSRCSITRGSVVSATSPTRSSHASTAARRPACTRRGWRASGSRSLEAMACGTPVVVSSHPSLDEASGEAALRASPDDPNAIAAAIEQALRERERLAALGLEHAARFSWRAVGEIFLARLRGPRGDALRGGRARRPPPRPRVPRPAALAGARRLLASGRGRRSRTARRRRQPRGASSRRRRGWRRSSRRCRSSSGTSATTARASRSTRSSSRRRRAGSRR